MLAKIHHGYKDLPEIAQRCVVAIGNFDGVHRGHAALIDKVHDIARETRLRPAVMTFEPHPRSYFDPDGRKFRLTMLPAKRRLFSAHGIMDVFVLEFDAALASLTADEFIEQVLVDGLDAAHIVVGEDFAFGKGREGDVEFLKNSAGDYDYEIDFVEPVRDSGGAVYSSTAAREAIREGYIEEANGILGHEWEIEAPVIRGDQRGREIGFPTANQDLGDYVRPAFGIYAVRVKIEGEDKWRDGVANIGIRPMFEVPHPLVETYIFDFDADIYDKQLRVRPVKWLRGEENFDGLDALTAQIEQDCNNAKAVLEST